MTLSWRALSLTSRDLRRAVLAVIVTLISAVVTVEMPDVTSDCGVSYITSAYAAPVKRPTAKDRAKADFKRGKQAFNQKRYVEALTAFESAYQSYPLPLMLFNIASVYEQLNLLPQALEKYEAFIKTGKDQAGEAAAKADALRGEIAQWVEVRLSSQPAGSEVRLIDARLPSLGKTPLTLKLPAQRRLKLLLKPPKGELFQEEVLLSSSPQRQSLSVKVPEREAWVRVIGSPRQARVKSGSVSASGLPALLKLSIGEHELEVLSADYLPIKQIINLRDVHSRSAPLTVQVELKSSAGVALISLDVKTPNALLLIDGVPQGRSPFSEPFEVAEGEHLVEVKGPKGESFSEQISLKSGETSSIEVDFSQSASFFTRDKVSLSLMGVGSASLLTGLILGGVALSNASGLEECRAHDLCARRQGELERAQAVRTYATSADILVGLGVAIGAAGGVLYWLDHREMSSSVQPKTQVSVLPLPGGAGIHGSLSF